MGLRQKLAGWLSKAMGADVQAWVQGMDVTDNDQGAKMQSPYQQSAWIYIAISVLAENVAQIPFRISRVGKGQARRVRGLMGSADPGQRAFCRKALTGDVLESGDVVDLFESPHPTMGRTLFWEQVVSWEALRGEFFILPTDDQDQPVDLAGRSAQVRRLITLPPELFWHIVTGYHLEGWRYTGSPLLTPVESQILLPSEVIQCRNVNPYLYWRGMSPMLVATLPASADYAAEMFQKGLLMNNADTGIIATTEQNLTPEQREQFTAALRERKRKAGTPDRPLFLSSGVKIEKPTISNVDMQFLETRRLLRQEIGAIFKVPESLMGFSENKTSALSGGGAALNQEKLTFIEQTIAPKCHRIELALAPVVKTFGEDLVGWFDLDSLPVMQEARRSRVDTAVKVFGLGVPLNDINEVYDLGFPEYKWGKTGFLPFNLAPADQVALGPEMPGEDEGEPTGGNGENGEEEGPVKAALRFLGETSNLEPRTLNPEQRKPDTKRLWERHVRARASTVKLFQGKVGKVLNQFRAKTLAKLNEVHLHTLVGAEQRGLVDLIFSANEFGNALRLVMEQPTRAALQTAGEEARKEVGANDPWTSPPKFVAEFLSSRSQPIMGVGGTVRDQLNTSLEAGYDAGETTAELAGRVKGVFNDLTDAEALRVARTETNLAFNAARHEALGSAGIEYKAWLSSHGPRVRPGHAEAEETYIDNPIPLDQPFIVDLDGDAEEMMYPGDDSLGASPGNIINCQCIQLAATKEGEESYKVFGLGTLTFKAESKKQKAEIQHCCT